MTLESKQPEYGPVVPGNDPRYTAKLPILHGIFSTSETIKNSKNKNPLLRGGLEWDKEESLQAFARNASTVSQV
jgi:hypothetical protein